MPNTDDKVLGKCGRIPRFVSMRAALFARDTSSLLNKKTCRISFCNVCGGWHILVNKYGNIPRPCLSKHVHASTFEATICDRFLAQKTQGEIEDYDIQVSFDLIVAGHLICRHVVDFAIKAKGNIVEVVDAKGKRTRDWQIKYKLFKVLYPDIPYRTVQLGEKRRRSWRGKRLVRKAIGRR